MFALAMGGDSCSPAKAGVQLRGRPGPRLRRGTGGTLSPQLPADGPNVRTGHGGTSRHHRGVTSVVSPRTASRLARRPAFAGSTRWLAIASRPLACARRLMFRYGVGKRVEQRREALPRLGLGIGGAVLAQLPRGGEAAGIEPGQQPHQQPVARHALLRDQSALLPDLLGAAVDRAIEGDGGEPPDGELVRRVPGRGEGRRAGAQLIGRARGEARGGAGEMDRAGLGEGGEEQPLPLGAPAGEALAAVLQRDAVEGGGGDGGSPSGPPGSSAGDSAGGRSRWARPRSARSRAPAKGSARPPRPPPPRPPHAGRSPPPNRQTPRPSILLPCDAS